MADDIASPRIFAPSEISTAASHEGMSWVSSDQKTLVFTRASSDFSSSNIHIAKSTGGAWRTESLSISSPDAYDAGFSVSPDNNRVLFTSTRPTESERDNNWNIWVTEGLFSADDIRLGAPRVLPNPVNSEKSECCAVFTDEDTFYFSSDRNGDWDIFRAERQDGAWHVSPIAGDINSEYGEWPSAILDGGLTLLFSSIRPSGLGGDDIYVSYLDGDKWSMPVLLPEPINSASYEDSAFIAGASFYWSSRRSISLEPDSVSNIFSVPASALDQYIKRD
ncbi:MAG: hypothetical protein ACX939_03910 [Hyphococcus sp.]